MNFFNQLLISVILVQLLGFWFLAVFAPEDFGKWLQKIDTGRYEYLDCDCTDPLQ